MNEMIVYGDDGEKIPNADRITATACGDCVMLKVIWNEENADLADCIILSVDAAKELSGALMQANGLIKVNKWAGRFKHDRCMYCR